MSDIGKFIADEQRARRDPAGNLSQLEPWTEERAEELAREEGIDELTHDHWAVVRLVRDNYREHGDERNARELLTDLEERFSAQGGRRYLYQLFPRGPVVQSSRIAGVPLPPHATDPSFGTVE